jgi:hypothetical protein
MQRALRFLNRNVSLQAVQDFKDKYCPNGNTCIGITFTIYMISLSYIVMWPYFNWL